MELSPFQFARPARNTRRWWCNSGMLLNGVLDLSWVDKLGIPRLA